MPKHRPIVRRACFRNQEEVAKHEATGEKASAEALWVQISRGRLGVAVRNGFARAASHGCPCVPVSLGNNARNG